MHLNPRSTQLETPNGETRLRVVFLRGSARPDPLESRYPFHPTEAAANATFRQPDYLSVWRGLGSHFEPEQP